VINAHALHGTSKIVEPLVLAGNTDARSNHEWREDLDKAAVERVGGKLQYPAAAIHTQDMSVCPRTGAECSVFDHSALFSNVSHELGLI
jgi:hypothetical protein